MSRRDRKRSPKAASAAGSARPRSLGPILVPTDFSAGARKAVERAACLAPGRINQLHIVHVLHPAAKSNEVATRDLAEAAALARKTAQQNGLRTPSVETKILRGEAYVEIIRYAREIEAQLMVVGRKGAGTSVGRVLGTTAARALRMSETPVLVVGSRAQGPYRRPLIALPLDPSGRKLVELVRAIAGDTTKALNVVRAYHVPFTGFISPGTEARPTEHHLYFRNEAAAALEQQVASLGRRGVNVKAVLRKGDARSVILEEAVRRDADLIAVGTHARSGIAHVLLGSVAEWVVNNAASDVLVARPVRFTFELP